MVINDQKPLPHRYAESGELLVHSIFPTIQGEGPLQGERALFIRLYGCNLQCPGCDTEYTSVSANYTPQALMAAVRTFQWPTNGLIVLTGGEPLRQNVLPFILLALSHGWRIQIETNGVLWPPGLECVVGHSMFAIVCSPKTAHIHPRILENALAFKYVIREGEVDSDGLPLRALGHKANPCVAKPRKGSIIFVQPMDEDDPMANERNLQAAMESCTRFGYRLQVQLHKFIGVD